MFRALSPTAARWRPLEGEGLEHLTIRPFEHAFGAGFRAESVVIGGRDAPPYGCRYRIDLDAGWCVRAFSVERTDGVCLALASDGKGHWRTPEGAALPQFDGCIDIDISATPFTNTLPIRRLGLTVADGTADLTMLYIPIETLRPFADGQHYTCLENHRLYRYQAADRSFAAELPVDADGLVTDYPTLFQRL